MNENRIRAIAFVTRCAGAATIAHQLASALGLPEALWAVMSALIVSQERLDETGSSLGARVLGTLLGIAVTIAVGEVAFRAGASTAAQMAVAIGICALVTRSFPRLRVAMWTCPIVLLSAEPSVPIVAIAFHRGSEVVLGAAVGWAFHWAAEILLNAFLDAERALHGCRVAEHAQVEDRDSAGNAGRGVIVISDARPRLRRRSS
jgi:uncharacterized membrane protein YccC